MNKLNFCSLRSYLLRGGIKPDKEQRHKKPRKYQVVITIIMGLESSYVTVTEGYFGLEAIRDSPEEVMLRLRLKGNNV